MGHAVGRLPMVGYCTEFGPTRLTLSSSTSMTVGSVVGSLLCLFSLSESESVSRTGLVCRLRWRARSPGEDFGRGSGSIQATARLLVGEGALSPSLPSIEPECRRRREGTIGRSIFVETRWVKFAFFF